MRAISSVQTTEDLQNNFVFPNYFFTSGTFVSVDDRVFEYRHFTVEIFVSMSLSSCYEGSESLCVGVLTWGPLHCPGHCTIMLLHLFGKFAFSA